MRFSAVVDQSRVLKCEVTAKLLDRISLLKSCVLCLKKTLLKMLGFYFAPAGGGQRPPEGSDYCSCKEIEQESGRVQRGRRVSRGRIPVDVRQRMYPLHLSGLPGLSLSTWL